MPLFDYSKVVAKAVDPDNPMVTLQVQTKVLPAISKQAEAEANAAVLQSEMVNDQLEKFRADWKRELEKEARQQKLEKLKELKEMVATVNEVVDLLDDADKAKYAQQMTDMVSQAVQEYLAPFDKSKSKTKKS